MKAPHTVTLNSINYTLLEPIGNGGSGTVWKARSDKNEYAIKILDSKENNKLIRFNNEITFCQEISHNHIIKIVNEGDYDGKRCYVMPLYPETLRDIINKEESVEVLINYILKVCNAINFIHKKGHFHRDIKPENILIKGKELVLADFGIAHFKNSSLTKKGDRLSNRIYAAPEQKKKNNDENITGAADIFSLGLIINECFTKHNPSGFDFKSIADIKPIYAELDYLVNNMIRQNPSERPSIDSVITEIKFIHKNIKNSLKSIATTLRNETQFFDINKTKINTIIRTASEDILFGKFLFITKSVDELFKYNYNWHMKIGYTVDDFLFNVCVQEKIYALCKAKFTYESNIYKNGGMYKPLDIEHNEKHKLLYMQIKEILLRYPLNQKDELIFDLSGEILKYFSACVDYHCREILYSVKEAIDWAEKNLKNAPIIWIVGELKESISKNGEYLFNSGKRFVGQYDFDFAEHISISYDRLKTYDENPDDTELIDVHYIEKQKHIQNVLLEFNRKWKVIVTEIDDRFYSIKFKSYNQFAKFRKFAHELSHSDYIFEGDVIDILANPKFIGNMVELKVDSIFDIPYTISKLMGFREI